MPLREDGTATSEYVYDDCGFWWFRTEDDGACGPYKSADEADDALKRYCEEFLGSRRVEPFADDA